MKHARRPLSASLAALSLSGLLIAATAQSEEPENGDAIQLDTVNVTADTLGDTTEGTGSYTTGSMKTATGLDLSIKETPQSVSVVTSERIKDQGMNTVSDALKYTTGVSVKPVDRGRNNLSVRGFEVNNFQLDGIPVANGNVGLETSNTALYDRIEVVRGATGLLSGAGDPSATVNMVRKHADSKTFTGSVSAEAGSWDHYAATADLSTPLTADGSVRGRFVANGSTQNAFIDLEHTENSVFYAVVDADLTDKTRLSVGASQQRDDRDAVMWAGMPYWYADGGRTDWSRSSTSAAKWNRWDTIQTNMFANVTHQLDNGWVLRGDANYSRQQEDSPMLWVWGYPDRATGTGMSLYPYHYFGDIKDKSLNLIATGPFQAWGREHELTTGLTYSRRKEGWNDREALEFAPSTGNFNLWDGSYPYPLYGSEFRASRDTYTETGAYSAARLQVTDDLKFILGGRLSNWKLDQRMGYWTREAAEIDEKNVFTPYAGVVYDIDKQYSAYASYTEIFNPQPYYQDASGNYLDPLEGINLETGIKGSFFDNRLNASAAVFYIDQDNFAVQEGQRWDVYQNAFLPAYKASQGVKTPGYELEVSGALSEQWEISAGWTQFSAEDAEHNDVAVDHPREMLKLFTKYELDGNLAGLSVGGGMTWESKKPARDINPGTGYIEEVGMGSYALFDLMASYDFNEQLSVQMNLNNVFDKQYRYGSHWWGSPYTYGEPRNLLVSLEYTF